MTAGKNPDTFMILLLFPPWGTMGHFQSQVVIDDGVEETIIPYIIFNF
jgi:hypothetical protein